MLRAVSNIPKSEKALQKINIDYIFEYDFASEIITDARLALKDVPCLGNIRVGHMKEPFSLEELTSDNWLDFMERSIATTIISISWVA